jgi:hypothetical protein
VTRNTAALLILLLFALGCATPQSSTGGAPHYEPAPDDLPASLFPGDAEVLSDAQIGDILAASPGLSVPTSIAIIHLQHVSAARFWGYGPYWAALQPGTRQQLATSLSAALLDSGSVASAEALPTFLLPEKPSVAHIREASARFRTESVLIYRSDCQAYEHYRFFASSEAKAFCSVEAALLDTRTGIVPLTSSTLRDFTVKKQKSDANMLETVRRAEAQALSAALSEIGTDIGRRLGSLR